MHNVDDRRGHTPGVDSIPKEASSAARSAPMLALPNTWMPWRIAQRISLCQTAGTASNSPSTIPIARGRRRAAR
jgi:hypothetical protein